MADGSDVAVLPAADAPSAEVGQRRVMAVILLCVAMSPMTIAAVDTALPGMATEYGATADAAFYARLMQSAPTLAAAMAGPIIGALGDRLGAKPLMIASLLTLALGGVAFWIEPLPLLLGSRIVAGLGAVGIFNAAFALIGLNFEGSARTRVLAFQGAAIPLAAPIWIIIGGAAAATTWRGPFLLYFLCVIPALIALYMLPRQRTATALSALEQPAWPSIAIFIALSFVLGVLGLLSTSFAPFLLKALGMHNTLNMGAFIGGPLIVSAVAAMVALPSLRSRWSGWAAMALSFSTLGAGLFVLGLAPSPWIVSAGLFLCGIGLAVGVPTVNQFVIERTTVATRGLAFGICTSVLSFGNFVSPLIVQSALKAIGTTGVFTVLAVLCAGLAGAMLMANRSRL